MVIFGFWGRVAPHRIRAKNEKSTKNPATNAGK